MVYGSAVGSLALAVIPRLAHILYKGRCPCGSNLHDYPFCKAKRPRRSRTEVNVAACFQRNGPALGRILTTLDMISDMVGSPTLRDTRRIWGVASCVNSHENRGKSKADIRPGTRQYMVGVLLILIFFQSYQPTLNIV